MSWATITVEGALVVQGGRRVDLEDVETEVGPEGWAKVYLDRGRGIIGWVNDIGLLSPEKYPRNITGSILLALLGGPQQPYAGRVVLTGYRYGDQSGYPEPLDEEQVAMVQGLFRPVALALCGETPGEWDLVMAEKVRGYAELVRTDDSPVMTWHAL
jgi:hypothetical protein